MKILFVKDNNIILRSKFLIPFTFKNTVSHNYLSQMTLIKLHTNIVKFTFLVQLMTTC